MKKVIVWFIVFMIVVFFSYRVWIAIQKSQKAQMKGQEELVVVPVKTETVKQSSFIEKLSLVGDMKGIEEIKVFPKISGKLVEMKVKEGDEVKRGSVVALIDRDITGLEFKLAEVTSPIKGVVSQVYLDKGAGVSPPNPSPSMGTAIVEVVDMDIVLVMVNVIEKDISKVKLGQRAYIKVDAYPEKSFIGKVTSVSPTVDRMTRTAKVEITISNLNHRLKPGMFAQVEIVIREKNKAILIPGYSILEKDNQEIVYIIKDGRAFSRRAEIGVRLADLVEVIKGLSPEDKLVVSGQHRLSENDTVNVVEGGIK